MKCEVYTGLIGNKERIKGLYSNAVDRRLNKLGVCN